ncbi:MAG: Sua5/YciO/YrdC/YwlC family protein, partial [Patescibacteria group bacterium]
MKRTIYFLPSEILEITESLKGGGVGVFPTDTVYGLGGRADKLSVIRKIYRLKKRDKNKPLLILVSSVAM